MVGSPPFHLVSCACAATLARAESLDRRNVGWSTLKSKGYTDREVLLHEGVETDWHSSPLVYVANNNHRWVLACALVKSKSAPVRPICRFISMGGDQCQNYTVVQSLN